ncbi:MAG: hypothetical protein WCE64_14070 [Bacteroidales bacterium]
MPSVRKLKKDINSLIFEVISDCFTFGTLHPDDKADEVSGIISDAVALRNDLITRINNPDAREDQKALKKHFREIEKNLFTGVDNLCKSLSALSGKEA